MRLSRDLEVMMPSSFTTQCYLSIYLFTYLFIYFSLFSLATFIFNLFRVDKFTNNLLSKCNKNSHDKYYDKNKKHN